jgi:hypothetical protein
MQGDILAKASKNKLLFPTVTVYHFTPKIKQTSYTESTSGAVAMETKQRNGSTENKSFKV